MPEIKLQNINLFNMKKYYLFAVFLLTFISVNNAQDCTGFHQYHCTYGDYTYFYSKQSKSALFARGQTSEMKFIVYGGEEYYINICAHRKFGDIQFKIFEDTPERTLIYDNSTDDYSKTVEFVNEVTRKLIIEVTVPDEKGSNDKRCVGVLIQFRKLEDS